MVCVWIQEYLVAIGVRGATLQHRVVPPSLGWYDQVRPCFQTCKFGVVSKKLYSKARHHCCLTDSRLPERLWRACVGLRPSHICHHSTSTPVELLSRLQVRNISNHHLMPQWNVLLVFTSYVAHVVLDRPLYLPIRSLLAVETFSISSSLSLDHSCSTLRC